MSLRSTPANSNPTPAKPLHLWMDVMRDLEHVLDDHERLFEAWAAGGVTGLVLGPLEFRAAKLLPGTRYVPGPQAPMPTFDPDPAVYRRFGVETPPAPTETLPERRAQLDRMLTAAKDRGWSVYIFQAWAGAQMPAPENRDTGEGGRTTFGHMITDERIHAALCARMVDTLNHYPMVDGAIMDGPEWGYEIAPHHYDHRSYIFHDLPPAVAASCARLGYDYDALVSAKDRLYARLHALNTEQPVAPDDGGAVHDVPARLQAHSLIDGMQRLMPAGDKPDPDLAAWLQFRADSLTDFFARMRQGIDAQIEPRGKRPVQLGVGPRSASFAPLCGYDLHRLAQFLDILLPKHYFFHRGFDGMLGTIGRYLETLTAWNSGLSDAGALDVIEAIFGLRLPGVEQRADLESALTPEFFQTIVTRETRLALAAVDDPARIVPWVDAGRAPHDGDPMPASELRALLLAAQSAGLQRFLYHHHGNLTAGEWTVMSELCGTPWHPLASDYTPPDQLVL